MRRLAFLMCISVLMVRLAGAQMVAPRAVPSEVVLMTTTTTRDAGILEVLVKAFEAGRPYRVKAIVAGSGDILKQAAQGEGDVVLAHSPEAERAWMAQGHGSSRRLVMYNDFILVGPPSDPAKIRTLSLVAALKHIAAVRAPFLSRGDSSGTHVKERKLWANAGLEPKGQAWYRETGQGQGLTLEVAAQQEGYALTDRGTFLVHRARLGLEMLVENDSGLLNIYHVMTIDPKRFPRANAAGGRALADWLVSPEGQAIIAGFGKEKYGRPLFTPAAGMAEADLLTPKK